MMPRVHWLGASALGQFSDVSLCDTVLMVCTDSTKRDCLSVGAQFFHELIAFEDSIVRMAVVDDHSLSQCTPFEGLLGLDGVLAICGFMDVDAAQAGEVVNEDGRDAVPSTGQLAAILADEARCGGNHLVNGDNFSWSGGCPQFVRLHS